MNVRLAALTDEAVLRGLWEELEAEVPEPPEFAETWEDEWADVAADIGGRGAVYLAEDEEGAIGFVRIRMLSGQVWHVAAAYVRERGRRRGVLKKLLGEAMAEGRVRGAERVTLDVLVSSRAAVLVWERLGFETEKVHMAASLAGLEERLMQVEQAPSTGAAYVQTDDRDAVDRAVQKYLPRIGRSEATAVREPQNGWVRVDDELCDRDPKALRRLGRELSLALGAIVLTLGVEEGEVVRYILWDRGGIADEYASLPEYYGPLPPGDVVALGANPTVTRRLTGADAARVRAVARTAATPDELPPADELVAELADVLGVG